MYGNTSNVYSDSHENITLVSQFGMNLMLIDKLLCTHQVSPEQAFRRQTRGEADGRERVVGKY
jgi:hypothetical protein